MQINPSFLCLRINLGILRGGIYKTLLIVYNNMERTIPQQREEVLE